MYCCLNSELTLNILSCLSCLFGLSYIFIFVFIKRVSFCCKLCKPSEHLKLLFKRVIAEHSDMYIYQGLSHLTKKKKQPQLHLCLVIIISIFLPTSLTSVQIKLLYNIITTSFKIIV